ncbi:dTDP-4-dehydrorhamnose 3,5-epimerase [Humibacter ginsengiterrae]
MQIRELSVPNAYEISPIQHRDDRGVFLEWYRFDRLEEVVGHPLNLRQANTSVSRKGSVRGIHFADVPVGQAKYVTCTKGIVLDFAIDIREGSPAFGTWDTVLLDDVDRRAAYLAEGLGHCFIALTDDATVSYLVSDVYNPTHEHGISPLDADIALKFPFDVDELLLSPKDTEAPSLAEAREMGLLPDYGTAISFYESMRGAS